MKTGLGLILFGLGGCGSGLMAQSSGTFAATGTMIARRFGHTATLLPSGKVLITGGSDESSTLSSAEIYNPATGTFAPTGKMSRARRSHSATLLADGRVLITGGFGPLDSTKPDSCPLPSSCGPLTSAEIYNPSSGAFTLIGEMSAPGGPAVLLPSGKAFISAGFTFYPPAPAELYDPFSAAFSAIGAETPPTTATLLPNGQVLLTTADDWGPGYAMAGEIYDPSTDTFNSTNNINYETATLLMNGKVLFISDPDHDIVHYPNEAQLYDPATGTFAAAGNMTVARDAHTATLLPDGTALIAGSQLPGGGALASAEIYDPVLGTFRPTGSMITARHSHEATLLNNGQVLITGGFQSFPTPTSSAELYTPQVLTPAPVLFALSPDGQQGAIWHATTEQAASANNPAITGDILSMYTTSLSLDSVIPPQVSVGGRPAQVLYFGAAPGYPGYYQVNFRVPSGIAADPAIPVRLLYLGRASNVVTIGVQ
jgi:hypothetical protein